MDEDRVQEQLRPTPAPDPGTGHSGAWEVAAERARERGRARPLRVPLTLDAPTVQGQAGIPWRIERLKLIEAETDRARRRLRDAREKALEQAGGDPQRFRELWEQRVARWSFLAVNELVAEHNEWFPLEASLRWDLELGDYRAPFGLPWRRTPLDAAWALREFPATHP